MSRCRGRLLQLSHHTSSFLSKAAQSVKALVSGEESLPVTRVVQAVLEGKSHPVADALVTLDPKLRGDGGAGSAAASAAGVGGAAGDAGHTFAVVFMIGGGNYKEYHNLQDYSKVRRGWCGLAFL